MTGLVLRERRGEAVELITLNRPEKRNALSTALLAELQAALVAVAADSAVRVVVLTGADPAFCAGVDLGELSSGERRPLSGENAVTTLRGLPQPSIAAVNGACVTGGLELAISCDVRIASERARFADTHVRVGVHPGWGMTAILPRLVGSGRARDMSLTGDYVDAVTAERWGLVSRVVVHDELLATALSMAEAIAGGDPATLGSVKRLYDTDAGLTAALEREQEGFRAARERLDPAAVGVRVGSVIAHGREQAAGEAG